MSTFYILPPRPLLGRHIVDFLQKWFPGLNWDGADHAELAETISAAAGQQAGVYIVFREDLPDGVELQQAMLDSFGAEVGDEVVEVATEAVRRWRLAA